MPTIASLRRPIAILCCVVLLVFWRRAIIEYLWDNDGQVVTDMIPTMELDSNADVDAWKKRDAYGLFLVTRSDGNDDEDPYYKATRSLVFQLLHNPATKDDKDVLILVSKTVPKHQVERLRMDGAIVRVVEPISIPDDYLSQMKTPKYIDMMTKLRFWQQVEYRRIYVMDSDVLLIRSLDFVWDHVSSQFHTTLSPDKEITDIPEHNTTIPNYVFAASLDSPKKDAENMRFCAGSFLLSPSSDMFELLDSLRPQLELYGGLFNTEQNLLNFVFKPQSRTPWHQLHDKAIINFPPMDIKPLEREWASVHAKYWERTDEYGIYGHIMYGKMLGYYMKREDSRN